MGIPSSPSLLLAQDPFGDLLKKLMKQIHQQLEMPDLKQQFGTQMYEQQVVQLSKDGKRGLGWGWGAACEPVWAEPLGAGLLHLRCGLSGWNF